MFLSFCFNMITFFKNCYVNLCISYNNQLDSFCYYKCNHGSYNYLKEYFVDAVLINLMTNYLTAFFDH